MASKVEPYADVTCSPPCRLPSTARLEGRDPPDNLERQVKLMHSGLRRVAIEALGVRTAKGEPVGIFQRFAFTCGSNGKPDQSPRMIALIAMDSAEMFARKCDHLVKFRVYVETRLDTGKIFEKQVRVTVDPSKLGDGDEDEDDDADDDDDEIDDEDDPEDAEDDREEENDAQDEYDEDDDTFEDIVSPPAPPAPRVRVHVNSNGNGRPRDVAEQYVDPASLGKLEPQTQIHESVEQAQRMGLQPDYSDGLPLAPNPMFFLQLMDRQTALVARIFHGSMRESRKERRLMRREFISALREGRRTMRLVTDGALAERDLANRHAENLGQQIIDITTAQRADIENYQQIAAHSWKAFRHAQDAELSMAGRILGYERALFDERLAAAEDRAALPSEPSQWPGMLKSAAPTLLGVGAFIANQKGDTKMAELLGSLATLLAPKPDEYDDEDVGDDEADEQPRPAEDVVDAEAREAEPAAAPKPAPTRDGARALLETIDAEQATKLRNVLPRGAWEAFEQTANARTESSARLSVRRLDDLVRSDAAAQGAVMGVLRAEQVQSLFAIIRSTQRRGVPPRPRASAAAG